MEDLTLWVLIVLYKEIIKKLGRCGGKLSGSQRLKGITLSKVTLIEQEGVHRSPPPPPHFFPPSQYV